MEDSFFSITVIFSIYSVSDRISVSSKVLKSTSNDESNSTLGTGGIGRLKDAARLV